MRAWLFALALMTTVLAGCADEAAPVEDQDDFDDELGEDLQATDDTGIIRGVVVDPAIVPLVGVNITIKGTELWAESNENGAFGFGDLEPGAYVLKASKPGYISVEKPVVVEAGVDDPAVERILLDYDEDYNPYSQLIKHQGMYACGTSVLVVCGAPAALLPLFGQEDPTGVDRSTETFYFGEDVRFVQTEMYWKSNQALSPELYFEVEALDEGCSPIEDPFASRGKGASGESPIRVRMDNATLERFWVGGEECGLYHSVFAGGTQGTPVGFSVQQDFEWYITSFYGFDPDEDWWFINNGEHPVPE